jgi:hypothetical protein
VLLKPKILFAVTVGMRLLDYLANSKIIRVKKEKGYKVIELWSYGVMELWSYGVTELRGYVVTWLRIDRVTRDVKK